MTHPDPTTPDAGERVKQPRRENGILNKSAIRALLSSHLGISRAEIAKKLGLSPMTVTRHVTNIRSEWGATSLPTKRRALAAKESPNG